MKKIISYFFLAIFILGSCKKEHISNNNYNSSGTPSADINKVPLANIIPTSVITSWLNKNPVGRYLTLDWTKAQQAIISGVPVVKVPVLTISKINSSLGGPQINSLQKIANAESLNNFDINHPPALYFFKDSESSNPDSVRALLMNFIPDHLEKEDGDNNIWTGKLMEWSMQSDTIPYQTLSKSYVHSLGLLKIGSKEQLNSGVKTHAIITHNIFADIWNAITSFFDAIGEALGIPGTYSDGFAGGTVITGWCSFLGGLFCGGSPGSGGSYGGSGGSGVYYTGGYLYNVMYSSYINGYNGVVSSGGFTPYVGGSGGNPSPCPGTALASTSKQHILQIQGCTLPISPTPPPSNTNKSVFQNFEDRIDDSKLTSCFQSIVNATKLNATGTLSYILGTFMNNSTTSLYNWKISNGTNPDFSNAKTTYSKSDNIVNTIIDESKFANSTDLVKIRTILHEAIHGYLLAYFKNDPAHANIEYAKMVDAYAEYFDQGSSYALDQAHHDEFVKRFVNDMALSLKNYGDSKSYNLSIDFYKDLTWGGLTGTHAFSALTSTEQTRILNFLSVQQTGVDSNGDLSYTQKGKINGCGY